MKTKKQIICSKCKRQLSLSDIRRKPNDWKIKPLTKEKIDIQTHQIRVDEAKGGKWRVVPTSITLKPEMLKLLPIDIERRTFQRRLGVLSQKVLGKKISPHTLRHGFGNYLANIKKLPLPSVQAFMGHSKIETTGIYTKVNPVQAIDDYWKTLV